MFASLTLVVLCCASLCAQYSQTLSLGRSTLYSVPTARASVLTNATPLMIGLRSAAYVGEVGGVTFESVARPDFDGRIPTIQLSYVASNPDGRRLWVRVDDHWVVAPIYDWQMIPIANFAASKYTACFTLFGDADDLGDNRAAEFAKQQHGDVIAFHPALKNTLVGLRLMQLDMLIISEDAVDLPKQNGRYVLGRGESVPNIAANENAMVSIDEGLVQAAAADSYDTDHKRPFQSYIINDKDSGIRFSVQNNMLSIRGAPTYYTFWVDKTTKSPVPNRALNRWLASNSATVRQINPAVWDNAVTTAQYAAFFRYVKANNPSSWQQFLGQINGVQLTPAIGTPNLVVDPRILEAQREARRAAIRRFMENTSGNGSSNGTYH